MDTDTEDTASTGIRVGDRPTPDDKLRPEGTDVEAEDQGRDTTGNVDAKDQGQDTSGSDGTKLDEFGYPQPPP